MQSMQYIPGDSDYVGPWVSVPGIQKASQLRLQPFMSRDLSSDPAAVAE